MDSQEVYLGGISSPHLVRGMMRGYELHATTKRLIGLKNRAAGGRWLIAVGAGGPAGHIIEGKLTKDQNLKTIQELDQQKKDLEVSKDQISRMEVKKPGTLTRGHVLILQKSGESVEVKIADKRPFQQTLDLLGAFYPEALTIL